MHTSKIIIDQIQSDVYNIQVLIDLGRTCGYKEKTRLNQIQSTIKTLIREIRKQKDLITDKVYKKHTRHLPALFEIEPSEIEQVDFGDISSFFGIID